MFDRELLVNSTVDLDMGSVWATACNAASDLMERARQLTILCEMHRKDTDPHPWCAYRSEARMLRATARHMMMPFRSAIAERTRQESEQAWSMARTGNLRFAASWNTNGICDRCDRPCWQHISANEARILCPFWREYWTYARAIDAQGRGITLEDTRVLLSIIARPIYR